MSDFGAELKRWMQARGVGVRELHRRSGYSAGYISQLRQGRRSPSPDTARDLDDALAAGGALAASNDSHAAAASSDFADMLSDTSGDGIGALAAVLTGHGSSPAGLTVSDVGTLATAVNAARTAYQDCRYDQLTEDLTTLIAAMNASCAALAGDPRDRAHALSADAHHVAAGLMLKRGDLGLATLAADRSMRAALASGDAVAVAASARILTHALLSGGHATAAVAMATSYATRLDQDVSRHSSDTLSVYGALLLRGAVAAAEADNRRAADELLTEAEEAARRLGHDGNHCWTAFGPLNTAVHRVSIAVTLGDAGTALDTARGIPLQEIKVTERKAALLIDTARALMQRKRHDRAYAALRAAHQIAPQEVAGRGAVRALVRDLAATAPVTLRRDAARFASRIGATA